MEERLRFAGLHFLASLAVAVAAAVLVLGVWYPYPYSEISGGRELFQLVITVDVILGPLVTLVIFNAAKGWPVLRRDLAVVAAIQLAGLAYGLSTVHAARPVHLVFEYNRYRVVHAIEVPTEQLKEASASIDPLPLLGPTLLSLRPFRNSNEMADATLADVGGLPLAARPGLWQPYLAARAQILQEAKPVQLLKDRFRAQAGAIDEVLRKTGRDPARLGWLPLIGRKTFWTAFVDLDTLEVVAFLPLDPF